LQTGAVRRAVEQSGPRAPHTFAMAGAGGPAPSDAPPAAAAPSSRRSVDWGRWLRTLFDPRVWILLAALGAVVLVARACSDVTDFFEPSGREVAAAAARENAEVNKTVAEHERDVTAFGAVRADETRAVERRTEAAVRDAQQEIDNAIANLPPAVDQSTFDDLHARYHDALDRVWNDGAVSPDRGGEPPARPSGLLAY
ncbi:MAG: hypothetical protein ACREH4_06465, partial [Vitreimonas sp.]